MAFPVGNDGATFFDYATPQQFTAGWSSQAARRAQVDTKLKADIAESAVVTELLTRGFRVLRPVGDRLPYDLAIDSGGRMIRIQVKSAWYEPARQVYTVDVRRTKTNRRVMLRSRYQPADFDFAILYVPDRKVYYVLPYAVFSSYGSGISLVETNKRQRSPRSSAYRGAWHLLSNVGCPVGNGRVIPAKFGETSAVHEAGGW